MLRRVLSRNKAQTGSAHSLGLANRGGRAPEKEARNRLDAPVNDDTRKYPANRMIVTKGADSTNRD